MKNKVKKICLFFLITINSVIISTVNTKQNRDYEVPYKYLETINDNDIYWDDNTDDYYFYIDNTNDFRILQLTDLHIGGSLLSASKDDKAFMAMKEIIDYSQPDLIIVTGDLVYTSLKKTMSYNNRAPFIKLCDFFQEIGIPWTFAYGNHDTEAGTTTRYTEFNEITKEYSLCLFQKNLPVGGRNNLIINACNKDMTYREALVLLDSGEKSGNKYGNISEEQLTWYETRITQLNNIFGKIKSMMFFHIPPVEFIQAQYKKTEDNVEVIYGRLGEEIAASADKNSLFDKIKSLDSTQAMFVGHDHLNDLSFILDGVRCTYGKSIDYLAYNDIEKSTYQRGGTLITIDENSQYEIIPITLTDLQNNK